MKGQLMQWLAVGFGAAIGACLRSSLSSVNPVHAWIPLGTLSANIMGGFLIGIAMVIFLEFGAGWHPNVKLFIVTGFLGGLTTFSTFSSEVFSLFKVGRIIEAMTLIGLHVALTLIATVVGYYVTNYIYKVVT